MGIERIGATKQEGSVIRHSQSYLFGAISGTAVIAAAVVFFVLFVSAQALRDWPISRSALRRAATARPR